VDAKLEQPLSTVSTSEERTALPNPTGLIIRYWLIATVVGVIFLWDWITAWNVPATLSRPALVVYLVLSFALSQILYALVARYDGRRFSPGATVVFALGNGIAETFAFAVVYRLGEMVGSGLVGLVAPELASWAGLAVGIFCFAAYGGLIHGLFWLKVLPPHLNDTSRAVAIRKYRPVAEVALVLGWSLCLWLTRDLWTVVFFHILVDIGLMIKVRPLIFGAH
jgi:uncharacterized membrane protein YbaN (DUF454 family)